MKTAICTFCAQTGMYCKDCQTKINNGEVTQTEIKIAKIAAEFEKTYPNSSKVNILKTIEKPGFVLLLVTPGDLRFLTGGSLDFNRRLERTLKKPVKIMEKTKNKRKIIDEIFHPALIKGFNTVFVPVRNPEPGKSSVEEEMIVVLSPEEKDKLPGTLEELKELVKLLTDEEVRVEFR
ncbi:MAG TPA: hypothetical protein VMX55_12670 [candidate division Zixibacteria bacterium]|nr:hypothetical protein [candidate division Zixibacteria bacterium]